ncbi:MAG: MFS transporter [Eubacterium sp.]|nr:MFS transporter [Eubacterium sp.]
MNDQSKSNYRKFMLLWAGELVSSIGGGLTSFGLGIYIFQKTGNASGMALMTLLAFLPGLLLKVPAGVLADRYDRRLLMMIGDGCSGLGVLFILLCMLGGEAELWQIYLGVIISSVFSALLEPAFTATITDLLTKEQFSRANGLVSMAGSARYLFSPILAGFILAFSDIKVILIIDICTFFLTIVSAAVVRKNIAVNTMPERKSFLRSMKEGWEVITKTKGLFLLILISSAVTMFMGVFQVLGEPFVLSFADSKSLGIIESVAASGMLFTGVILGIKGIRRNFVKMLSIGLFFSGIGMAFFGVFNNTVVIALFGFLFFASLPIANNSLDYLARTNIPEEVQGRAWGFIGFISQLGYVIAYALSGITADAVGAVTGGGVGKGAALTITVSGIGLALIATLICRVRSINELEKTTPEPIRVPKTE